MLQDNDTLPKPINGLLITPENAQSFTEDKKITNFAKEVTLESFYKKNPIILFFYPKDMTPGCTIEVQKFRNLYSDIQKLGYEVIGCSKDKDTSHCKFISKYELPYPLLSDINGEITNAFGVWGEKSFMGKKYMGITRSTFIINKKGIITKAYHKVSVNSHAQEVLDFIKNNE